MGWHLLQSFRDLQSNGVTVPLRNKLLFVVTSNYFVTFEMSVTSNCNGTVTRKKMGNGLKVASYFHK